MPTLVEPAPSGECPYCRQKMASFILHPDTGRFVPSTGTKDTSASMYLSTFLLRLRVVECPSCRGPVIDLLRVNNSEEQKNSGQHGFPVAPTESATRLYPATPKRYPPAEVKNEEIRRDYMEAHAVAQLSTRGAAALARRALQHALRETGFAHPEKKLWQELKAASLSGKLSTTLIEKLRFLKGVGDDSVHPNYYNAGEVVDVDSDEFEMLSEVLDEFFDELYVKPARHKAVMEARKARNTKGLPPPDDKKK